MAAKTTETLTSVRAIQEAIDGGGIEGTLFVAGDTPRLRDMARRARDAGLRVRRVSRTELRARASAAHDCAFEITRNHRSMNETLESVLLAGGADALFLVLDHVTDPHNYGAILRCADQFGVQAVVVPERRAAPLSAVAIQASAGTAHHVRIVSVANLASALNTLKEHNVWVYAADMDGEPVHRVGLSGRTAIVLGSEGKGVSRLVSERSDRRVRIPTRGHADSLNVSVACGVLLYEIRRQQGWLDRE